jgi:hypothetical protein
MPNTYTELDTKSLSSISSITFTSIPQTYTDLVLVIKGVSAANQPANFRVGNGSVDTGSNYSRTGLSGNGSSATSYRGSSEVYFYTDNASDANGGAVSTTYFMNYSNTTTNKTFLNRNGATSNNVRAIVGLWRSTVAINTISADFGATLTGGTASLYGIANADQGAAKATGGIITEDSQYWYHTFAATGTFIPKQAITADVLVLAGGGAGSVNIGGGGGAGGLFVGTSNSLSSGVTYTCTVGAGGAKATYPTRGAKGTNTTFSGSGLTTITATGGGAGAVGSYASSGEDGGSGGGGAQTSVRGLGNTPSLSPSQGNNGGGYISGAATPAGGGGGAGAIGGNGGSGFSGAGGAGSTTYNSWSLATSVGELVSGTYYLGGGGGGGGGTSGNVTPGAGGLGGGAIGGKFADAINALANTGGGGGAGGVNSADTVGYASSNGGSGVVIVRYAK